ncbi:hypothetical protein SSBR45G_41880 [Bradyrhizobium sp. SSBR45G]|uniref:hypothetical protein n=1 Tax=unclassified Bradyrhizobium TaxID=2631580 RepID=UPI002342B637|nr:MULTISPECIES: hypothetical protein [unclassified Bradyrhizobium]GLH79279.1 hypothetical protein SSBR45G_41880 [Bradyrhizobium sp. SSBR45G]GLH86785.1 hypothetical protein SSBR45R_42450 [Bradyrhizobium sp. SSBR45R]
MIAADFFITRSMSSVLARIGAVLVLCVTLVDPAATETIASAYTSAAAKDCRTIGGRQERDSSTQTCPGKDGLIVLVNEGDLRQTVSVGRNVRAAAKEPAAQSWFGPFNAAGNTVEWRTADGKPFAIIQRWQIADNDDQGKNGPKDKPMLVVTRLPPGPVCHVAYVDAAANTNANELARQAADETARGFACGKDKIKIVGMRGRAIDLALPPN